MHTALHFATEIFISAQCQPKMWPSIRQLCNQEPKAAFRDSWLKTGTLVWLLILGKHSRQ